MCLWGQFYPRVGVRASRGRIPHGGSVTAVGHMENTQNGPDLMGLTKT